MHTCQALFLILIENEVWSIVGKGEGKGPNHIALEPVIDRTVIARTKVCPDYKSDLCTTEQLQSSGQ
jgi:hypothetical protein